GRWEGGTWSPRGLYVAAWRGRRLAALAPDARRAWTIEAPAPVRAAAWSPEGFHVAYLAGRTLRVVGGDGRRDRLLRERARPVAPAFRPGRRRTLAWVSAGGRIEVFDVFSGAVEGRSGPRLGRDARALTWTGD